jgi:hypothetical protein
MRENLSEQIVVRLTPSQKGHVEDMMKEVRANTGMDRITVSDVIRMVIAQKIKEKTSGKA